MQLFKTLVWCLFLTGCSSTSMTLINQRGDTVRCAASGNFQGAFIADSMVSSCIADYRKFGFIPSPQVYVGMRISEWHLAPIVVLEVAPSSPASEGKVSEGDRIIAIDEHPVSIGWDVIKILALKKPNDALQLTVERDGQRTTKALRLSQKRGQ